ncbi:MAG: glycerol-3-phosphate responsive antiterminator [Anaerovoracaceae bacterium]|jgi:glycerol uptake operon antiterminator|nr:glycerol-3-phosphate responsive antiterminator [Bacillota bacterium]MBQ1630113.1 glycerol-3-phosphate responsive antiterminator [Bacillota bacterium]MBQ2305692.1 glycerol-3-phosphate responsive antiterminator [Bacillota bacterium]MBR2749304.1 glycerol-3-phosphate responsive antiterminator [Bacillota bacterium]MEE3382988.1 glycerol-3-phosphate responsive antiterminator [Anaerovoracaceae bacterium]
MIFDLKKVVASVRTDDEFKAALRSDAKVIFLQNTSITNADEQIRLAHDYGKTVFIHTDFMEGIGKDKAGLQYLRKLGCDGMLSTRTGMIRHGKDVGLLTVQRFFIVDTHSVDTAIDSIKIGKPDFVEIMPGVIEKTIKRFASEVDTPVIAGGLINKTEEVDQALSSGAVAVSTGQSSLWNYR